MCLGSALGIEARIDRAGQGSGQWVWLGGIERRTGTEGVGMTWGRASRKLTDDDAALLGVLSQGGLMEFKQIARALGETDRTWRRLYRRVRRLRGLPSDGGQTVSRFRLLERVRDDFRCPVCGQGRVAGVTRSFSYQWGAAEFRYQHAVPDGQPSEGYRCTGPRMTIAEGKRLRRAESAYALVAPEPELLDTAGTRVTGAPKLVYGLSDDGAAALREWLDDAGATMEVRGSPTAEGWRFLEHALLTSEVYVRTLVAAGCARRPWAFPAGWELEPGALKWSPPVQGKDGRVEEGALRYVKPDITMLLQARPGGALEKGRRIFIEVERGTQALTDPNLENAGAVESKVKRYESFCCYAPTVPDAEGRRRSYYRQAFPEDAAEPWLVVVAEEKRKRAILRALGERESLSAAGFHAFRVRVVSFEQVGRVLAALAGVTAQPAEPPVNAEALGDRNSATPREPPGVRLTLEEASALGNGTLQMRLLYERLRERVRASNEALPPGVKPIAIERTPDAWASGARPLVERLLRESAETKRKAAATPENAESR